MSCETKTSIHLSIILLSPAKKKKMSCLNQERQKHRLSKVYIGKQSKTVQNKYVSGFWETTEDDFFTEGSVIMDNRLILWLEAMVLIWTEVVWITCELLWCFYQLFGLSFWWHPFTAEDPLVSKWCNPTFLQICSDEETNSTSKALGTFSANIHFWVNYSFKDI